MTTLRDIFEKPVDRAIEGVIKADDEASLRVELEEYVITNEIERQLEKFLAQKRELAKGVPAVVDDVPLQRALRGRDQLARFFALTLVRHRSHPRQTASADRPNLVMGSAPSCRMLPRSTGCTSGERCRVRVARGPSALPLDTGRRSAPSAWAGTARGSRCGSRCRPSRVGSARSRRRHSRTRRSKETDPRCPSG